MTVLVQAKTWFQEGLGYSYNLREQGLPADWLLDLVSIGFHNSLHSFGFQSLAQLEEGSQKFVDEKMELPSPVEAPSVKGSVNGSTAGNVLSASHHLL